MADDALAQRVQQLRLAGKQAFVQRVLDAGAQQDEAQACWELFSSAEEVWVHGIDLGGCMPVLHARCARC